METEWGIDPHASCSRIQQIQVSGEEKSKLCTDDCSEIGMQADDFGERAQGDKVVNKVVSNLLDHPQIFTFSTLMPEFLSGVLVSID